jgi:hypothetical protein
MARTKSSTKKPARAPKAPPANSPARRALRADPIPLARAAAFTTDSPAAAFEHFRAAAERVPAAGLPPFTGQPLVMLHNVRRALAAVEPHLAVAVERMPGAPLQTIFELPAMTLALDYAAARVPVQKLSTGEIDAMLAEGRPWRELYLSYLEVVSHPLIGLVPRERVAAVRKGSGKLDAARDFVALPGLFEEFAAALEGKHPFAPDTVARLGELGNALVRQISPGSVVVTAAPRAPEAILRNQLAKLVEDGYDALAVVATVALGKRAADELLPALRSTVAFAPAEPADGHPTNGAPSDGAAPA